MSYEERLREIKNLDFNNGCMHCNEFKWLISELEKRDRQIKGLISELRSGYRACGVSDTFTEAKIQSILKEG